MTPARVLIHLLPHMSIDPASDARHPWTSILLTYKTPAVRLAGPPNLHPPARAAISGHFTLAWLLNVAAYLAACVIALVFGVLFAAPAFTELLLAWLAALLFTWLVVEPSEVLALVLLPGLTNSKRMAKCRATCKDLGFV